MSQILSSSNKLNREQIETTVKNLAECRHFTKIETIYEGKPTYSEENISKMKSLGIDLPKVTKFATNYIIYKLSEPEENESSRSLRKYYKDAKIKNLNDRVDIIIVLDQDKFDKQFIMACASFWPMIHNLIKKGETECRINICPNNLLTTTIESNHLYILIFPVIYKIFSLYKVYPLIGSKRQKFTFTRNYEVLEHFELYNHYKFPVIKDFDPVTYIMGAEPGDIIICQILLFETSPYFEYSIREVKETIKEDSESDDEDY